MTLRVGHLAAAEPLPPPLPAIGAAERAHEDLEHALAEAVRDYLAAKLDLPPVGVSVDAGAPRRRLPALTDDLRELREPAGDRPAGCT